MINTDEKLNRTIADAESLSLGRSMNFISLTQKGQLIKYWLYKDFEYNDLFNLFIEYNNKAAVDLLGADINYIAEALDYHFNLCDANEMVEDLA